MSTDPSLNNDLLVRLPATAKQVLEVSDDTNSICVDYLARNPKAVCTVVRLNADVSAKSEDKLSRLITGHIESPEVVAQLKSLNTLFDLVILGDGIERLRDPWKTLRELSAMTAPGGICVACVSNIAHWSVMVQQLQDRWDEADHKLLHCSNKRYFTLPGLLAAFEKTDWNVIDTTGSILNKEKTDSALAIFRSIAPNLGISTDKIDLHLSAYQWVMRVIKGPVPKPLLVVGVGLAKNAGCYEARIEYPLASINTLPDIRAKWGEISVLFTYRDPGVIIFQRRYFTEITLNKEVEDLIKIGFAVVLEIDDDPRCKEWEATDYYAFKRVHAVTVSTEALATIVRQLNPNVRVFPNAIFRLPPKRKDCSPPTGSLRIFFGALNREADWKPIIESVVGAALETSSKIEFVVVHDKNFFDRIPESFVKEFHSTLCHQKYLEVLSTCDIALLPLADNEFNRMKSDLKLIECSACCVVPICSPTVYADNPHHTQLAIFASSPEEWGMAIHRLCGDSQLRQTLRDRGYAYVKANRMHAYQAEERRQYYYWLMTELPTLEWQRQQRMQSLRWRPVPS